ncbi:MAG: Ig-like domain-containing protein [Patescibacteria group bacterium]
MKKARALIVSFFLIISAIILVQSVEAQSACPVGYFQYGDFCCNNDPQSEKPGSAVGRKFCQPQITGCQASGGLFCSASTRNACCSTSKVCGTGTVYGAEVAVCVPPPPPTGGSTSVCSPKSPGYIGRTKDGKNVCCGANEEAGPAGHGLGINTPYCQPKRAAACAPGEQFIQGADKYDNEKRCCPTNTAPTRHPNGMPFCAKLNLPSISITSPATDQQSVAGSFPLSAAFTAVPNSSITAVQLFIDNKFERQSSASPSSPWTVKLQTWKLAPGPHAIKFVVTDNLNRTASAERLINVAAETTPPTVKFISPSLGTIAGDRPVNILVSAQDETGIGQFQVCLDGSCSWTCPTTSPTAGALARTIHCSVSIPISRLFKVNPLTSVVTAVAYDQAYEPNLGAVGVVVQTN